MVSNDPRINQNRVSTEEVSSVITDRAIELLGMLNNAVGANGQQGALDAEIILEGEEIAETLSRYRLEADANEGAWKETETVYYKSTAHQVGDIADELQVNLDNLKSDIVNNLTGLFDILKQKDEFNADGQKSINELEQELLNATSTENIFAAENALKQRTKNILTSEEALSSVINIFFETFNLSVERMNSEIFDKLHDFDDDYADGSTDIKNEKLFYERPASISERLGLDPENSPALIIDSPEALVEQILLDQQTMHENVYGAGSYSQEMKDNFLKFELQAQYSSGTLKLSDDVINLIIANKNLSKEDLDEIKSMREFLDMVSFNQLLEYVEAVHGVSGDTEAITKLMGDHLKVITPKYYSDKRSIHDILSGRSQDVNSVDTKERVFASIHSQVSNVASGVEGLYLYGYDKVATNDLQINIRKNPFAAVQLLESQRSKVKGNQYDILDFQVQALLERQIRKLVTHNDSLVRERREIQLSGEANQARLNEIETTINKLADLEDRLRDYNASSNASTRKLLDEVFPNDKDIIFDPEANDIDTFMTSIDAKTTYENAHRSLYVFEDMEASKKNAEHYTKKLPTPQTDGSIPEDTMPLPPLLSPSPLSAVIARIGDTVIEKSRALINGDDIPTTEWMADNTSMLLTINEKLSELGASSNGEAFINNLKDSFKGMILDFFNNNSPLKEKQDQIKTDLIEIGESQQALTALKGSGFNLNNNSLNQNFNEIENALNGNVKSGNNFINKAGVEQTNTYLESVVDDLDATNYEAQRQNRYKQISELNDQIRDGMEAGEDVSELTAQRSQLQREIIRLNADENNLDKAKELLNEINAVETSFKKAVNNSIKKYGGNPNNPKLREELDQVENKRGQDYKAAVKSYSDSLTDFDADADGDGEIDILSTFKTSLNDAEFDLDGNGKNDFIDIQNIVTSLEDLSETIENTFGGLDATEGGIQDQSIRRLILLMFFLSILEAGEWQQRRADSDTSRYANF